MAEEVCFVGILDHHKALMVGRSISIADSLLGNYTRSNVQSDLPSICIYNFSMNLFLELRFLEVSDAFKLDQQD
jgi:hypothetical protein